MIRHEQNANHREKQKADQNKALCKVVYNMRGQSFVAVWLLMF